MNIGFLLANALIYFGLVTGTLLIIGLKNPRLMLQDYPKSIQQATTPKTAKEKRQGILFGIPFLIIFIGYPLFIGLYIASSNNEFWHVFRYVYALLFLGNAYDLLIIDWLIICYFMPSFIVIPGTEGNKGYKDYRFHFIGFLKGLVITLVLAFILTGIVKLIA